MIYYVNQKLILKIFFEYFFTGQTDIYLPIDQYSNFNQEFCDNTKEKNAGITKVR